MTTRSMDEADRMRKINLLTKQIDILKRKQWPGIEEELEQLRAELRRLLTSLPVPLKKRLTLTRSGD